MPDIKEVLENKKRMVGEAEERLNELMNEIATLKAENENVLSEKENVLRRTEMKKSELARKEAQRADLRQKMEKAQSENEAYNQNQSSKQMFEMEYENMSSELSDLMDLIREKETRLNSIEMRLPKLRLDIDNTTSKLAHSRAKSASLEKELNELQDKTDANYSQDMDEDEAFEKRRELEERLREISVSVEDLDRKITLKSSQKQNIERTFNQTMAQLDKILQEKKALEDELMG